MTMLTNKPQNARKITKTLTRTDLAKFVAKRLEKDESDVAEIVEVTIDSLSRLMRLADPEIRIELRGLGVFEVKFTKASSATRNPRTGQPLNVPLRRKTHFRASKVIKRVLQKEWKSKPDADETTSD